MCCSWKQAKHLSSSTTACPLWPKTFYEKDTVGKKWKNKQNSWHWKKAGFFFSLKTVKLFTNRAENLDLKGSLLQKQNRGVFPFGKHWWYLSIYWEKWTRLLIDVDACLPPETFQIFRIKATRQIWSLILLFEDFQWSHPSCIQDQNHLSFKDLR